MFTYKQQITIDDPNHVVLSHLPFQPGQKVEVLFLVEEERLEAEMFGLQALFQKTQSLPQIQTITEEGIAAEITEYHRLEKEPVVRVMPIDQNQQRGRRIFGAMRGKARVGDAFFEPLPENELSAWES